MYIVALQLKHVLADSPATHYCTVAVKVVGLLRVPRVVLVTSSYYPQFGES